MKFWHTLSAKQRARVGTRGRAAVFGVEAQNSRMLPLVTLSMLFILAHAAPLVGLIGLAIFLGAVHMRRTGLIWIEHQRAADLAERNEDAATSANESNLVMTQAKVTGVAVARVLQLPPPQPAHARSGRSLPSICLTPRILSQRPAQARITRAICADYLI